MMKKKLMLIIVGILLITTTGCLNMNTPTSQVEAMLNKYNTNDEAIVTELDDYLDNNDLTDELKEQYRKIYLKQFSDLKYEIKEEVIDGDTATVTAQITVYDFYKTETESNNYLNENREEFYSEDGVYDKSLFETYKLEKLDEVTDKVDYTIDFTLTKVDGDWQVDTLTNEQLQKIHGVYAYE